MLFGSVSSRVNDSYRLLSSRKLATTVLRLDHTGRNWRAQPKETPDMKNPLRTSIVTLSLALPLLGSVASAQTTSSSPSSPSSPSTTVAQPATTKPVLQQIITSSNAAVSAKFRTTELASVPSTPAGTAWSVISTDASLSEFAALVKATGLEGLFSKPDSAWTYVLPTNDAFKVFDQAQVARLKDARFKEQASLIVRQQVLTGRVVFADFVRRLPTGVPGVTVPASQPNRVDSAVTESGKTVSVQATVVRTQNSENRFRIVLDGKGMIEIADFPVSNGVIHTIETLQIPSQLGSLTDIVGRR